MCGNEKNASSHLYNTFKIMLFSYVLLWPVLVAATPSFHTKNLRAQQVCVNDCVFGIGHTGVSPERSG